MDPLFMSKLIEYLSAGLLLVLIAVAVKVYLIVTDVRNMTKRLETLTDITGWLGFIKKFTGKK